MENRKVIKITVPKPILVENVGITHIATSYQVSLTPRFDVNNNDIVYESLEDTVNLLVKTFPVSLNSFSTLFVRTKYHYSTGSYENWSNIIPLKSDNVGIKLSGTVLQTPDVKYELSYDEDNTYINITTTDMKLYAGAGNHISTTYIVTDIYGKEYYRRENDTNNLTSILIDGNFIKSGKNYIIKVKQFTDTNSESLFGKCMLLVNTAETKLFDIEMPYKLVPKKWLYFNLTSFTNSFLNVDIIIEDDFGNTVASNLAQRTKTPRIFTGNLDMYFKYTVKARIRLIDGEYTSYRKVYSGIVTDNELIDYRYNLPYLNKFTFTQEILLNGLTNQVTRETYAGDIFLIKNNDNFIYRYGVVDGILQELDKSIPLSSLALDLPFTNITPLHDGRILANYASDLYLGKYRSSVLKLYEYNPISKRLIETKTKTLNNEIYATSVSSSLVSLDSGTVYYIPSEEIDGSGKNVNLSMKLFDLETFSVKEYIPLPIDVKFHVSLLALDKENIMLIGGSEQTLLENNIESFVRSNEDIYVYNTISKTWTKVATLPIAVPVDLYSVHPVMRKDNKIVLFNSVETGDQVGNQNTINIDPKTWNITYSENDYLDLVKYTTTVALNNGDIIRISSRETDPQKVYTYISNTLALNEIKENTILNVISDLVIPKGKVVTIESPYRYNSITIQGTTPEDSGVLQWLDGDVMREFRYRDLIITRDTVVNRNLYLPIDTYDSITILEDVGYGVDNYIETPIETNFTISAPFTVTHIDIGTGGTLKVTY